MAGFIHSQMSCAEAGEVPLQQETGWNRVDHLIEMSFQNRDGKRTIEALSNFLPVDEERISDKPVKTEPSELLPQRSPSILGNGLRSSKLIRVRLNHGRSTSSSTHVGRLINNAAIRFFLVTLIVVLLVMTRSLGSRGGWSMSSH